EQRQIALHLTALRRLDGRPDRVLRLRRRRPRGDLRPRRRHHVRGRALEQRARPRGHDHRGDEPPAKLDATADERRTTNDERQGPPGGIHPWSLVVGRWSLVVGRSSPPATALRFPRSLLLVRFHCFLPAPYSPPAQFQSLCPPS